MSNIIMCLNQIFTATCRDKRDESCKPCWIYGIGMIKIKLLALNEQDDNVAGNSYRKYVHNVVNDLLKIKIC